MGETTKSSVLASILTSREPSSNLVMYTSRGKLFCGSGEGEKWVLIGFQGITNIVIDYFLFF